MSIPLDRLYHYIESLAKDVHDDHIIVIRFWPHGSKNINDLQPLNCKEFNWKSMVTGTHLYCHDQEPLCFDYYQTQQYLGESDWVTLLNKLNLRRPKFNIDYLTRASNKTLLLHSEKRSYNLEKYKSNNFIDVYYWSHALLARDWYRYAEHVNIEKNPKKIFLIYNRAWLGTREYRLKFADLLVDRDLVDHCQLGFNPVDNDIHYQQHEFSNPCWKPKNNLENFLLAKSVSSCSSADFDIDDYNNTKIEVVLETLFDDDRLHLTEKILRPIACNQPFVLAATHGSLQYLKNYGFKTFDSVWNEDYDSIVDPVERLNAIVTLMTDIAGWSDHQQTEYLAQAYEIARYNKQWFFSEEFFDLIVDELKNNLSTASEIYQSTQDYSEWLQRWELWVSYPEIQDFLDKNNDILVPTKTQYLEILKQLKR